MARKYHRKTNYEPYAERDFSIRAVHRDPWTCTSWSSPTCATPWSAMSRPRSNASTTSPGRCPCPTSKDPGSRPEATAVCALQALS